MSRDTTWITDTHFCNKGDHILYMQTGNADMPSNFLHQTGSSGSRKRLNRVIKEKYKRAALLINEISPGADSHEHIDDMAQVVKKLMGGGQGLRSKGLQINAAEKQFESTFQKEFLPMCETFLDEFVKYLEKCNLELDMEADVVKMFAIICDVDKTDGNHQRTFGWHLVQNSEADLSRQRLRFCLACMLQRQRLKNPAPMKPVVYARKVPERLWRKMAVHACRLDNLRVYENGYCHCRQCFCTQVDECLCLVAMKTCVDDVIQHLKQEPINTKEFKVLVNGRLTAAERLQLGVKGIVLVGVY